MEHALEESRKYAERRIRALEEALARTTDEYSRECSRLRAIAAVHSAERRRLFEENKRLRERLGEDFF